jgi:HAD superfamily hydrolase (TIGR01509 family)
MSTPARGPRESPRFGAVLFDWRGTLVHDPGHPWWITQALRSLRRPVHDEEVTALVESLRTAERLPQHEEAERRIDTSAVYHREATLRLFADAGMDGDLAEALYLLDFDPLSHPLYPDTIDVLSTLRSRGVKMAVVSDIHFDLRPEFAIQGTARFIDAYVLSFEHGVQKPDPTMFALALEALGVEAGDALMVGDRISHDGGAATVGIATLILPLPDRPEHSRLGAVVGIVG